MPSAIRVLDEKNLTIGLAALGRHGESRGSIRQQVHDGDTVVVEPSGNISVRLLAIDTPEVSYRLPGETRFRSIADSKWEEFLSAPFDQKWPAFSPEISKPLREHLERCVGPGTAENHHKLARNAEDVFENDIEQDMKILGKTQEDFQFFLAFGYEIMDGYGRFLCYINRDQPDADIPGPRPRTYNERLLATGASSPYFIWPNVNPWRKAESVLDAVPEPGSAKTMADEDSSLRAARSSVQQARAKHLGIFDAMDPLRLEPFELRRLASRRPPSRWVLDLSRNDLALVPPQEYHTIPNAEDRLFIPAEFVPLFVERGWKRG